jgi:hypothetical protein
MVYHVAVRKVRGGEPVGDTGATRPLRIRPDRRPGVVVEDLVRPASLVVPRETGLNGEPMVFADLDDPGFPKDECPFVETPKDAEGLLSETFSEKNFESDTKTPPMLSPAWFMAENAGGPYFVFDGDEALFEVVKVAIPKSGFRVDRAIPSKRKSDDGEKYDWFIRLDRLPEEPDRESTALAWLRAGLASRPLERDQSPPDVPLNAMGLGTASRLPSVEGRGLKQSAPDPDLLAADPDAYVQKLKSLARAAPVPSRELDNLYREALREASGGLVKLADAEGQLRGAEKARIEAVAEAMNLKMRIAQSERERNEAEERLKMERALGKMQGASKVRRENETKLRAEYDARIQAESKLEFAEGYQEAMEAEAKESATKVKSLEKELEAVKSKIEVDRPMLGPARLHLALDLLDDFLKSEQKNQDVRKAIQAIVKGVYLNGDDGRNDEAWKALVGAYFREQHEVWLRDDSLAAICSLQRKDEILAILTNVRDLPANKLRGAKSWREVFKPAGHIQITHEGSSRRDMGRVYWRKLGSKRVLAVFHEKKDRLEQERFISKRLNALDVSLNKAYSVEDFLAQITGTGDD